MGKTKQITGSESRPCDGMYTNITRGTHTGSGCRRFPQNTWANSIPVLHVVHRKTRFSAKHTTLSQQENTERHQLLNLVPETPAEARTRIKFTFSARTQLSIKKIIRHIQFSKYQASKISLF